MPVFHLQQRMLALLLLVNITLAVRFSFSIQEIIVGTTRDISEDDLVLVIAFNTGSSSNNRTWSLGSVEENDIIKWNNLTQEIDVPASASNLSVAIGILNTPDEDEATITETSNLFLQGIVEVAAIVPGPQAPAAKVLSIVLGLIGDLFKCDGPVVVGNFVYARDDLNRLNQNEKTCGTTPYTYEVPETCGFSNSSYTVTYCLERLDAKSAAANLLPDLSISLVSLAAVLLFGGYGLVV